MKPKTYIPVLHGDFLKAKALQVPEAVVVGALGGRLLEGDGDGVSLCQMEHFGPTLMEFCERGLKA